MGITYTEEETPAADKPKITYEERRKPPAGGYANLLSGADAMLSLGSGLAAGPLSGIAGLAGTIFSGKPGQGADWQARTQDFLTRQPQTQGGELITRAAAFPFELLHKGAVAAGTKAQDAGAPPLAATAVQTAIEGAPALVPGVGRAAAPLAEGAATRLMQSALKPTKGDMLSGKGGEAIMTMLQEGKLASKGGLEKFHGEIDAINNEIASAIQGSNVSVNKMAVADFLMRRLDEVKKQATPNADIASVRRAWLEFVNHPLLQNGNLIPVQLAQELKQGTYRALGSKNYNELKSAEIENQKTLARGLKEEIAAAVPEVGPLNARESKLINAANILEGRLATSGNRNPLSFGAFAPHEFNLMAWLLDRSDTGKSALANILYKASRPGGTPELLPEFMLYDQQGQTKK